VCSEAQRKANRLLKIELDARSRGIVKKMIENLDDIDKIFIKNNLNVISRAIGIGLLP